VTEQPDAAYDRGLTDGRIDARLANHDRHFDAINGSLARVADEMHDMKLAVQRLADQAVSDATTRIATAEALEKAEVARRSRNEQRWSPVAKLLAVLGVIVAVAAVVVTIYLGIHK
jgi:hypothetical protein